MRRVCLFLLSINLLFICSAVLHAVSWQRSITNYNRKFYRAAAQNRMIMQCENGWMYFANSKGLLEFDGTNWAVYPINNAKMLSLAFGKNDGHIYVGGLRQFGYFSPNSLGYLVYVCLSDKLNKKEVENVRNIHIVENRVYFQADNTFYLLENNHLSKIACPNIMYSALIGNQLYIASSSGLFVLNGHDLRQLPNTASMLGDADRTIVGLFPYQNKLLCITSKRGLFLYEQGNWTPFYSEADSSLEKNLTSCASFNGSLLALGTVQDGVYLLDMKTKRVEHISIHNGLQNKTVNSVFFDREKNLWLGLDNGIDCIHLSLPIFHCNTSMGSGYASCLYHGKLYLGTNQGVFMMDYPLMSNKNLNLQPIWQDAGQIYSLTIYDGKLFCAGRNALGVFEGHDLHLIPTLAGVWWVHPLPQKEKLLVATYWGLYLLEKKGNRWSVKSKVKGNLYSAKSAYIEPLTNVLWTANKEGGLYRIVLSQEFDSIIKEKNYNSPELPAGDNVCITSIDGEVVIASRKGLFCYNNLKDSLERYTALENLMDGRTDYTYLMQDSLQNIWYTTGDALKLLHYDPIHKTYYRKRNEVYLKDYLIEDFEHVNVLSKEVAIVGTEEGFSLLSPMWKKEKRYSSHLQVRYMYLTGIKDSLIYGCSYLPQRNERLQFPYKYNSVRIEWTIDNYDTSSTLLYSCRLEGPISEPWNQPSENMMKEYTMLSEGKYTFYVRTSIDGEKPLITSFSFEILPPWYRTWWSYIIYSLLAVCLMVYIGHQIYKRYKSLVIQRECEKQTFKEESELKDQRIGSLKEEKLQAELKYKSGELISKTLNIVRKNEILQDIRKEAIIISRAAKEEDLKVVRRKILYLITQINTNIEHDDDLQAFQNSFNLMYDDFFRKLGEAYPELSNKEKLLCAYIMMNLLSKEIAPLMNVSLRGVEISRYRLRKKLNVAEGESLTEFLQRFSK